MRPLAISLVGIILLAISAMGAQAQGMPATMPPILPSAPTPTNGIPRGAMAFPTYVTPAHVMKAESPEMKASVATSGFSPEFIHSIFPSPKKPGFMPEVAGKGLFCHGFGVQGGQYACYAAAGATNSIDCFFDRYLNETPVAQACGQFKLPANMQGAQTIEAEMK